MQQVGVEQVVENYVRHANENTATSYCTIGMLNMVSAHNKGPTTCAQIVRHRSTVKHRTRRWSAEIFLCTFSQAFLIREQNGPKMISFIYIVFCVKTHLILGQCT